MSTRLQVPQDRLQGPDVAPGDRSEAAARADIRRQIGRLEVHLARLQSEAFPLVDLRMGDAKVPANGGPRLLDLHDLEQLRDALAGRLSEARSQLAHQRGDQAEKRALLEEMLSAPARFKWCRISRAEVGEPGCGGWHSRPVLGLIGMLMGWWRVKISSGCP